MITSRYITEIKNTLYYISTNYRNLDNNSQYHITKKIISFGRKLTKRMLYHCSITS